MCSGSIVCVCTKRDKGTGQVDITFCSVLSYVCINLHYESDGSTVLQLHTIVRIGQLATSLSCQAQYTTSEIIVLDYLATLVMTNHV